ncbi:MAG: hypothetical protein M0Q95_05630 [Porticoccaceae bacterium]|jgi:hypothetical protein|nr:hypothetical protein [Porticoccaceae bacterium]
MVDAQQVVNGGEAANWVALWLLFNPEVLPGSWYCSQLHAWKLVISI